MTTEMSWIVKFLTHVRDMRVVWDAMGSLYNRAIYGVIAALHDDIVRELTFPDFTTSFAGESPPARTSCSKPGNKRSVSPKRWQILFPGRQ